MKKYFLVISFLALSLQCFSWGQTGHRIVGQIAEWNLTPKARRNIAKIMGNESLAMASNYMDFIKSDPKYRHLNPWHYATIPTGKTYEEAGTPEEGDVIVAINRLMVELESKNFSMEDELFALRCLIHLIGDIHQPLHVGNGEDRGGNDVEVEYFWEKSNLHRVWDSGIIDAQQLSYTEYAESIKYVEKDEIKALQSSNVLDWAYESVSYRDKVYDLPENKNINYRYNFDNLAIVNKRLLQAGIRLAGVLNRIYG